MFITRATRHDFDEIEALVGEEGWDAKALSREGSTLIARDGPVAGCVRLIEVEPRTVIVDDFVVRSDRRGQGIGRRLMEAAMKNRGGTMYLMCHDDVLGFYDKFGFKPMPYEELPDAVKAYFERVVDSEHHAEHEHFFLKAR